MIHRFCSSYSLVAWSAGLLLALGSLSATTITPTLGGGACGNAGSCSAVSGAQTITFDESGVLGSTNPYTNGIATFSFANGSPFVTGSAASKYATPAGDETTYLSAGSPEGSTAVTIDFSVGISYYGFYLGSADAYNKIEFFDKANTVATFFGNPANGDGARSAFINFAIDGGTVDRIVMSSSQAAFETDNHAYVASAPEPASIAMFGAGLLALACVRRIAKAAKTA